MKKIYSSQKDIERWLCNPNNNITLKLTSKQEIKLFYEVLTQLKK